MLIYHPAFDAFHAVFRMLILADANSGIEVGKARILDYFLVFPGEVAQIRLPRGHSEAKPLARAAANPYRRPLNGRSVFHQMEQLQLTAMQALAAAGLIDREQFAAGFLVRTKSPLPEHVISRSRENLSGPSHISSYIIDRLSGVRLNGVDGLKDRTGLMEYRYDNVETHTQG